MKERILDYIKENSTKPLSVQELEEALALENAEAFKELVVALNELELEETLSVPEKIDLDCRIK